MLYLYLGAAPILTQHTVTRYLHLLDQLVQLESNSVQLQEDLPQTRDKNTVGYMKKKLSPEKHNQDWTRSKEKDKNKDGDISKTTQHLSISCYVLFQSKNHNSYNDQISEVSIRKNRIAHESVTVVCFLHFKPLINLLSTYIGILEHHERRVFSLTPFS